MPQPCGPLEFSAQDFRDAYRWLRQAFTRYSTADKAVVDLSPLAAKEHEEVCIPCPQTLSKLNPCFPAIA